MEEFGLYDDPINTFYNKIDGFIKSSDKLKKEPKEKKITEIFSEGLGFCFKR